VTLVLHACDQLQLYAKLARKRQLILHVDATGGIVRKTDYMRKQVYLFSAVVDSTKETIPALSISDFLTESSCHENVQMWMQKLKNDTARIQHVRLNTPSTAPCVIVTDFSWPLIHASVSVFCGTTIVKYLQETFQRCVEGRPPNDTVLFSCSSHFIGRASKVLSRFFDSSSQACRQLLLQCLGLLICAADLKRASAIWECMVAVFNSRYRTTIYSSHVEKLKIFLQNEALVQEGTQPAVGEPAFPFEEDDAADTTLRSQSPYSTFFISPEEIEEQPDNDLNAFYNKEVLLYIHRTWLPFYALWGQPSLQGVPNIEKYFTNAKVESWFS